MDMLCPYPKNNSPYVFVSCTNWSKMESYLFVCLNRYLSCQELDTKVGPKVLLENNFELSGDLVGKTASISNWFTQPFVLPFYFSDH